MIIPVVLSLTYLLIYQNGSALFDQAVQFNVRYYTPYYGGAGQSNPLNVLTGQAVGFVQAILSAPTVNDVPVLLALIPVILLSGAYLVRRRWMELVTVMALLALSFPAAFTAYFRAHYFIAHYMVIVALAAVAVWQSRLQRGAALVLCMTLLPGLAALPLSRVDTPPPAAEAVNSLVRPGDTVWLAPAEFHDWLMIDAPNAAGRYYFIYPWLMDSPVIRSDVMRLLQTNRPAVIVYDRSQVIGTVTLVDFAPELTAWMDEHYEPTAYGNVLVLQR